MGRLNNTNINAYTFLKKSSLKRWGKSLKIKSLE